MEISFIVHIENKLVARRGYGRQGGNIRSVGMQMMGNQEIMADAHIEIDVLKREKTKAKSQFTNAKHHLYNFFDSYLLSRGELCKAR